jgi:antitoxin component YwqK of YwqJK toxin-antitoxin module
MSTVIREYYTNGILKATGLILNGVREGKWLFYYESGQLQREVNYSKGIEDGAWKMWHENGNLYLDQFIENGHTKGIWREYYENGRIKEVGEYIDGEYWPNDFWSEEGTQLLKNGTGKKIERFGYSGLDVFEHFYENGKLVKEVKVSTAKFGSFRPSSGTDLSL